LQKDLEPLGLLCFSETVHYGSMHVGWYNLLAFFAEKEGKKERKYTDNKIRK